VAAVVVPTLTLRAITVQRVLAEMAALTVLLALMPMRQRRQQTVEEEAAAEVTTPPVTWTVLAVAVTAVREL
jgi:hypothetical protein